MLVATFSLLSHIECGHYLNGDGTPHDMYHELHIPRNQPPYPTYEKIPKTSFSCEGKKWGYHADVESQCQVIIVFVWANNLWSPIERFYFQFHVTSHSHKWYKRILKK